MVNENLRNWIIENKIVVYCDTNEEAKKLLKITLNYDLSKNDRTKEEILIKIRESGGFDWSWQDGRDKKYFIDNGQALKCINFKDLPFVKSTYELW